MQFVPAGDIFTKCRMFPKYYKPSKPNYSYHDLVDTEDAVNAPCLTCSFEPAIE